MSHLTQFTGGPHTIGCARISPGRVEFPRTVFSAASSVTVTNTCSTPASVKVRILDKQFSIVRGCGQGELAPRQSCQVRLRFTSRSAGSYSAPISFVEGSHRGDVTMTATAEQPALAGKFTATDFTMSCPGSHLATVCDQVAQSVRAQLSSFPPLVMQVDPACTAQPCDYRLVDSSDTGAFTVIPDNGGFVISDQSIRAALEQITQDLGPGASEVAATHVRLNPTGESQGVVTSLNVEAAFDVAGQSLTETLALTRSPARQPTSATSP